VLGAAREAADVVAEILIPGGSAPAPPAWPGVAQELARDGPPPDGDRLAQVVNDLSDDRRIEVYVVVIIRHTVNPEKDFKLSPGS
jgi:hypothetical protein